MINLIETGLVYRNPRPHMRAVHAWHPTLVSLGDGHLLCAFDLGQAVESLDYRTHIARSEDNGQTWSEPQRIFEDENDRLQRHTTRLKRFSDGAIVGMGSRRYVKNEDEHVFNRETFGQPPHEVITVRSDDDGHTWTGPDVVKTPIEGPFEICHTIIELTDGRWLWPTSTLRQWDGAAPHGVKAIAFVSHDKGQTWSEYIDIIANDGDNLFQFEQSVIELPDGRLLAASWRFDVEAGISLPLPYAVANDGKTFSPSKQTGLQGETSKLLSLGDGRVLCVYRRSDKGGLWGNLLKIDGDEWVNLEEAPLWEGSSSAMGTDASPNELSDLHFGFPQPHLLPDGNVMIVFWCREDCIHNIRWLRVEVG